MHTFITLVPTLKLINESIFTREIIGSCQNTGSRKWQLFQNKLNLKSWLRERRLLCGDRFYDKTMYFLSVCSDYPRQVQVIEL